MLKVQYIMPFVRVRQPEPVSRRTYYFGYLERAYFSLHELATPTCFVNQFEGVRIYENFVSHDEIRGLSPFVELVRLSIHAALYSIPGSVSMTGQLVYSSY